MGQIQPIVPALPTQPSASSESPASADSGQFSPHLTKAVNRQQKTTTPSEKSASQSPQKKDLNNTKANKENDVSPADAIVQESMAANRPATGFNADTSVAAAVVDSSEESEEIQPQIMALPPSSMAASRPLSPQLEVFLQNLMVELDQNTVEQSTTAPDLASNMAIILPGSNDSEQTSAYFGKDTIYFSSQNDQAAINLQTVDNSSVNKNNPVNVAQNQDTLLAQLQQLINNSSERGQVSITGTTSNALDTTMSVAMSPLANQVFIDDIEFAPAMQQKNTNPLGGTRQTLQQQYYEIKMALHADKATTDQDSAATGQDTDKDSQSQNGTQQGTVLTQTTTTNPGTTERMEAVNFTPLMTSTTTDSPVVDTPKTVTLPSGLIVHEQEVLQQMIERFQFIHRAQDTRLNIRLHPAELGELKIDLSVHEGAIRANVIAQSQHVQEILERNMVKLRTILESQGFTVDEIGVATQSDNIDDFNMFDNHFFNDQDFGSGSSQHKTAANPVDPFGIPTESKATETLAGVNVTA